MAADSDSDFGPGPGPDPGPGPEGISDRRDARWPVPAPAELGLAPGEDMWVFGYGSLIWNPGFDHLEARPAVVHGFHRRFCVASHRYRGTEASPGLVLGLDRGGSCRGMAFRVASRKLGMVLDYLWEREMVTGVYRPSRLRARLLEPGGHADGRAGSQPASPARAVSVATETAGNKISLGTQGDSDFPRFTDRGKRSRHRIMVTTFVVRRDHRQYAGKLCPDETAAIIRRAVGRRGPCRDYLGNTIRHLAALGLPDRRLEDLERRLERQEPPTVAAGSAGGS